MRLFGSGHIRGNAEILQETHGAMGHRSSIGAFFNRAGA
jgi:hypothetical protein